MLTDEYCRQAESALGLRDGRERFLVVMGGIGEPSREEMVLKGYAEKREVKVCV